MIDEYIHRAIAGRAELVDPVMGKALEVLRALEVQDLRLSPLALSLSFKVEPSSSGVSFSFKMESACIPAMDMISGKWGWRHRNGSPESALLSPDSSSIWGFDLYRVNADEGRALTLEQFRVSPLNIGRVYVLANEKDLKPVERIAYAIAGHIANW